MRPIPRVSTRGYYDLHTGKTLKHNRYHLYPGNEFKKFAGIKELVVMIHGLRNDNAGAVSKTILARNRLRRLGYRHPVIGFSYDSNVTGAHLAKSSKHALAVGRRIAAKNGRNLGLFIEDFGGSNPNTKIRLIGHSLGSQVILSTLEYLAKRSKSVESVHFFGASVSSDAPSPRRYGRVLQNTVNKKVVNYFAPSDEVLMEAGTPAPLGLDGAKGRPVKKYSQVRVRPKNHRFASYVAVLRSFP